jgi:hypothetical protein
MNLITENPYRILGLLVGSTAAQQNRQITRLRKYIEAEQEPETDFSFPSLGELNRTIESIDAAASKLNLDADKMLASLFWFFNGNSITDEPAFDCLVENNNDEASTIWSKLTNSDEITKRNASAFFNLSSLYLIQYSTDNYDGSDLLENAVKYKLKFLESEYSNLLIEKATDSTFKISKVDLQLQYLNNLLKILDELDSDLVSELLEILSNESFSAKDEFLKSIIQKPIQEIEQIIENTKTKRKANKSNSYNIGVKLYAETKDKLLLISKFIDPSNIKYISISDKVSDELLQCGIDYFSYYRDTEKDPSQDTMKLFKAAKSLALGNIAKQRCKENTENLQEWIDNKPTREKHAKISTDFALLKDLIDEFEDDRSSTVDNAGSILSKSKNSLLNLKRELGSSDDLYIIISTRIAGIAQGMCVSEINAIQEKIGRTIDRTVKVALILTLKNKVDQAWGIVQTIGEMDISSELRIHYTNNRSSLYSLKTQLADVKASSSTSSSSSNGCYIATMAYGDYDHPQVLVLRKFRDEKLSKSAFGRGFIKTYYRYSPMLVEKLKNYDYINRSIRKILNLIIKLIK